MTGKMCAENTSRNSGKKSMSGHTRGKKNNRKTRRRWIDDSEESLRKMEAC